ncbi:hypothetical protein TNCV_3049021 [Trichonephila clavipes]|nr:hypothetical protein TNCV_3049021 [Trichonephila clavipes]
MPPKFRELDCTVIVSRNLEYHADDSAIWLYHPNFEGELPKGSEASHLTSPSTKPMRGLASRWLLEYPPSTKAQ